MPQQVDYNFFREYQKLVDRVENLERNASRSPTPSFRGFNAKKTGTQAVTASTDTVIICDGVLHNTGGYNEITGRFTVPEGMTGTWLFGGSLQITAGAGSMNFDLRVNGVIYSVFNYQSPSPSGGFTIVNGLGMVDLKTGDIVDEILNSGNANTIQAYTSFFGVFLGV